MNSLDFIDKEIEKLEQWLMIVRASSALKYQLKYLQQIKTELEAWEVVKRKGFIFTKEEKNLLIGNTWNIYRLSSRELNNKEYEILKKALEINDNEA